MSFKSGYVSSMRLLRRGLSKAGVLKAMEQSSRPYVRHLRTLLSIYDTEDLAHLDLPWWTYAAIDRVEELLRQKPARVFEYGSGASTLWLSQRAESVDSVEHDRDFSQLMERLAHDRTNVTFHFEPPVAATNPTVKSGREGFEDMDFANYVGTIDRVGGTFDLIIIDGRARVACVAPALARLNTGGLILFDDMKRGRYQEVLSRPDLKVEMLAGAKPSIPYRDVTALIRPKATPTT